MKFNKEKIATLGIGYLGNAIIVYAFDFGLYPFVMWLSIKWLGALYGLAVGCVLMTILSYLICWLTFVFYDWSKRDWLGIEMLKEVKETEHKNRLMRWIATLMKKSDPIAILFLSIKFDPFITTIYMRRGANQFNGLSKRDRKIFLVSLLIGNIYWSFLAFTGVSILEWIWKNVF